MNRPNLFAYATSELSQDAFLCWLLEWGDPAYKSANMELNKAGTQFIEHIFRLHNLPIPDIHTIIINRQVDGLDILAIVNDEFAILIEDKTWTEDHSNQLKRYREKIEKKGYTKQLPIFYKTGNQGNYRSIEAAGYKHFSRKNMLDLMEKGIQAGIGDTIFTDYYHHLLKIEASHNRYLKSEVTNWKGLAWHGFYTELQARGIQGDWGYVANARGGFTGFWWHWKRDHECQQYFQLEENKLCFKIRVEDKSKRRFLRNKWNKAMVAAGQEYGLDFKRPERFGSGNFMTVAVLEDYRVTDVNGLIDMEGTVEKLRKAEAVLDAIVSTGAASA
ncbi:PD-(D/E)XK nuclease family protein [Bacillus salacetis]|uniref:PD-(D/E)XK nuclease family protein n=1 Tax=Bacillus salacetis TaxID=2315464 RepID=UPI003BA33377